MIITIGICLIVTLAVLANYKALRHPKILFFAFFITLALLAAGISLVTHSKGDKTFFAAFFSPFIALVLLEFSRFIYRKKFGLEIILNMHGIYPTRHENRFVTRLEKMITFVITLLAVAFPILVMEWVI